MGDFQESLSVVTWTMYYQRVVSRRVTCLVNYRLSYLKIWTPHEIRMTKSFLPVFSSFFFQCLRYLPLATKRRKRERNYNSRSLPYINASEIKPGVVWDDVSTYSLQKVYKRRRNIELICKLLNIFIYSVSELRETYKID